MLGANAVGAAGGDSLGALISLKGWAGGGFTGPGAANDPAGIVHKGEYVLDANTTRRMGLPYLDRLSSGGGAGEGDLNVVFNVQGRMDSSTANQSANQLRRTTQRAARLT